MIEAIDVLNDAIQGMWGSIVQNPVVDDVARICLISFSDEARVIVPMSAASQSRPPVVNVEGGTNYGSAFRLLARTIVEDMDALRRGGYEVYRPCAFFHTDGEPLDGDWLDVFKQELTYDRESADGLRKYPIFVPFGFGAAPEDTIRRLAYPPGQSKWYHSRSGSNLGESLRDVLSVIMRSVVESSASVSTGRPVLVIEPPDEYLTGQAEQFIDDDEWI
jgi:uncharacterized protein YegL